MKRVVLVGLGLIGGSVGLALRKNLVGLEIVGVDKAAVVHSDFGRQLLSDAVTIEALSDTSQLAREADLVVLAMPVGAIAQCVTDWLQACVPVTDCGSTKQFIVNAAQSSPNRDWFLPGHPMAGRERGGQSSCSFNLFRGRRWIVCPEFAREQALRATRTVVEAVGAIWTEMTPTEHDSAVALTSHVPQILASWLAAAADERFWSAAGPAFSDMTRIAGGPSTIWKDIFATNAGAISEVLGSMARYLSAIAAELGAEKPRLELLLELLVNARAQLESPKMRLDEPQLPEGDRTE